MCEDKIINIKTNINFDEFKGEIVKIVVLDHFTATKQMFHDYDKDSWITITSIGLLKHIYNNYIVVHSRMYDDPEDTAYMGDMHYLLKTTIISIKILKEADQKKL